MVAGRRLKLLSSGFFSQGFALLAHQKYSRLARSTASQCSLFLHLSGPPASAAGSGAPLRPNELRSSVS